MRAHIFLHRVARVILRRCRFLCQALSPGGGSSSGGVPGYFFETPPQGSMRERLESDVPLLPAASSSVAASVAVASMHLAPCARLERSARQVGVVRGRVAQVWGARIRGCGNSHRPGRGGFRRDIYVGPESGSPPYWHPRDPNRRGLGRVHRCGRNGAKKHQTTNLQDRISHATFSQHASAH